MSKTTLATLGVVIVAGLVAAAVLWRPFDGKAAIVRELSTRFMEDLQFKDFRSGSLYSHQLDRSRFDIGQTLEGLFQVKPENLDIKDYRITRTDIDSTRGRAKVLVTVRYRVLNKEEKTRENEMVLYWMKRHPDCPPGGSCNTGECTDEFGSVMNRKTEKEAKKDAAEEEKKKKEAKKGEEVEEVTPDQEKYVCDVTKEEKWFMNLDSTLRGKTYRTAEEREKK